MNALGVDGFDLHRGLLVVAGTEVVTKHAVKHKIIWRIDIERRIHLWIFILIQMGNATGAVTDKFLSVHLSKIAVQSALRRITRI